jgi:hypothetical protein
MTSSTGTGTWTARTSASATTWHSVCWSDTLNLFIAVAQSGSVMKSPDGITWTSVTVPATVALQSVCIGDPKKLFVSVGNGSVGLYSNNDFSSFNNTLTIGTDSTSTVRVKGSDVVLYNVPYYYSEISIARVWTAATPITDQTIYNVPVGIYMCSIWFASIGKAANASTETLTVFGSSGNIFNTSPSGTANSFNYSAGAASTTTGPKYFSFAINNPVVQNISYRLAASTGTGTMFSAGWLRTFYLQRIG